jgi:anti-sigma B factor antagonist
MTPSAAAAHFDALHKGELAIVVPHGPRLDAEVASEVRAGLLALVDAGARKLVLDLSRVDFIDSSGLGALVSTLKRIKQLTTAGDVRLAHVTPPVLAVLEIIRLNRVFHAYPTVEDARRSFVATV